mmetsp:Transcript_62698/g.183387  ORF Transcript_62698/g.183387 Transcript_62698/m.183387 type:complete len:203 (-) Transcript_62698:176-784(-)
MALVDLSTFRSATSLRTRTMRRAGKPAGECFELSKLMLKAKTTKPSMRGSGWNAHLSLPRTEPLAPKSGHSMQDQNLRTYSAVKIRATIRVNQFSPGTRSGRSARLGTEIAMSWATVASTREMLKTSYHRQNLRRPWSAFTALRKSQTSSRVLPTELSAPGCLAGSAVPMGVTEEGEGRSASRGAARQPSGSRDLRGVTHPS